MDGFKHRAGEKLDALHVRIILTIGVTYLCKQLFSRVKVIFTFFKVCFEISKMCGFLLFFYWNPYRYYFDDPETYVTVSPRQIYCNYTIIIKVSNAWQENIVLAISELGLLIANNW